MAAAFDSIAMVQRMLNHICAIVRQRHRMNIRTCCKERSNTWPEVQRMAAHSTTPFICPIQNTSLACSDIRSDAMRFSLTALP